MELYLWQNYDNSCYGTNFIPSLQEFFRQFKSQATQATRKVCFLFPSRIWMMAKERKISGHSYVKPLLYVIIALVMRGGKFFKLVIILIIR